MGARRITLDATIRAVNQRMIKLIEQVVSAEDFIHLRAISGLSARNPDAVEKGLNNSLYGMQLKDGERVVGMGRVIGDGALNFDIVDIAVDPEYQGRGLGRQIMEAVMAYLEANAAKGAYITLMADVPELYEKFGFKLTRPRSEGMVLPW